VANPCAVPDNLGRYERQRYLVADKDMFHQHFLSIVVAAQQKTAFEILLVAFLLQ
jgi:hypothetical protein